MATISGKWQFNKTISIPTWTSVNVNFTNFGGDLCDGFYCHVFEGESTPDNMSATGSSTHPSYSFTFNYWELSDGDNSNYRVIDFGTTPQTVSEKFYTWFTANATKKIDDLTGTTWYVPSGWKVSEKYGVFSVDYSVEVPKGEEYSFMGDGFAVDGYKLRLGYRADWQFDYRGCADAIHFENEFNLYDDVYSPAYFTITFNGGEDVTNTSLISWFETYGELQSSTDEPTTPTKKFTRLYIGNSVAQSGVKCFKRLSSTQTIEVIIEVSYDASQGEKSNYAYIDNVTTGKRLFSASGKTIKTASINVQSTDELWIDCSLSGEAGSAVLLYDNEGNFIGGGEVHVGTLPLYTGYTLADVKAISIISYY